MAERAEEENGSLSDVFGKFAEKSGRAKGSVRNFYYELARDCAADESICKKYLYSI